MYSTFFCSMHFAEKEIIKIKCMCMYVSICICSVPSFHLRSINFKQKQISLFDFFNQIS